MNFGLTSGFIDFDNRFRETGTVHIFGRSRKTKMFQLAFKPDSRANGLHIYTLPTSSKVPQR